MPIYLDIFNLIVPKKVISRKYQGGIIQFYKDFRFGEFEIDQEDDELFSFGQMNFDCLPIDNLVEKGLHFDNNNQYSEDFTIIYRYGEDFWKVSWLQHNTVFAWHTKANRTTIKKAEEISNLTIEEISELIKKGQNPLKTIRINVYNNR